ncbi:MAG: VIT1/CCC1 transporter family protein [Acidimicrobiia bacterium]|nr:VIT1/CCC1 transporter family protein [Acidimicrobiia bacterium]
MAMPVSEEQIPPYQEHLGPRSQYLRDVILGVNDGLVSIFLLVVGVVGGGVSSEVVLLAGLSGAFAGAVSMAAGEYMATKSQEEAIDGELELEREHFKYYKARELDELRDYLSGIGLDDQAVDEVVRSAATDDEVLLELMKAFEFGVIDHGRRNPIYAMVMSGLLFLAGSIPSVLPFVFMDNPDHALLVAAAGAAIGLFVVGVVKTRLTRRNPVVSGVENVAVAGVGAVVSYFIGLGYDSFVS